MFAADEFLSVAPLAGHTQAHIDKTLKLRLEGNDKLLAGDLQGALKTYHLVLLSLRGERASLSRSSPRSLAGWSTSSRASLPDRSRVPDSEFQRSRQMCVVSRCALVHFQELESALTLTALAAEEDSDGSSSEEEGEGQEEKEGGGDGGGDSKGKRSAETKTASEPTQGEKVKSAILNTHLNMAKCVLFACLLTP